MFPVVIITRTKQKYFIRCLLQLLVQIYFGFCLLYYVICVVHHSGMFFNRYVFIDGVRIIRIKTKKNNYFAV